MLALDTPRRKSVRNLRVTHIRVIIGCLLTCASANAAESPKALDFFEAKIRPVLVEHCYECHSTDADSIDGELMLDSRAAVAAGGEHGQIIDAKDPGASRLLIALRYEDSDLQMPPDGKLPDHVIADFERWVQLGAPDPRDGEAVTPQEAILNRAKDHWAFHPPNKPTLPKVADSTWPRQPVDHFVSAHFHNVATTPAPAVESTALIRRLYYDLTGLRPSYKMVTAFASDFNDDSEKACETMVDALLASPQFGERWARHWLDLARYSDTKGYVFKESREYPNAYKYRDWVIDAFHRDLPYNEFLSLQLAADHLVDKKNKKQRSNLAALGYLTLGRRFVNNKHDIIDDRIDVVFRGMMGLTVSCARCHDHKYDPISAADYYGIYGIFDSSKEEQADDLPPHLVDNDKPRNTKIFNRGNSGDRGDVAPRQFPVFFTPSANPQPFKEGSGRKQLAESITDRNNPLTARVFVNRVWGHLFGAPLVGTTSDFGLRSQLPTEPELLQLLDYLAVDFMENDWSTKRLIRQIVLSSAYRQTSRDLSGGASGSLMRRRRADFESMRDSILQVASCLDKSVGGPSVKIETSPSTTRRTLYARIERQNLPGLFRTFDFANPDFHSPHRLKTTVPQQALFLLNSPFMQEMAAKAAQAPVKTNDARIQTIYRNIFSRDPTPKEISLGKRFIAATNEPIASINPWQFGYGDVNKDGKDGKVDFHPFERFKDNQWQSEAEFPGPKSGHAMLRAEGGHPGHMHGVIRRWTSPRDGQLRLSGKLKHGIDKGDGVQAWIVSDRQGILGDWTVKNQNATTNVTPVSIKAGEVIDLIVAMRESDSHDSFTWKAKLGLRSTERDSLDQPSQATLHNQTWTTQDGFHGPSLQPLTRWESYVQALMLTNEFVFID